MRSKILRKKQKAIEHFTQKLLASKVGNEINQILLFGSVARGKVDEYSDVDLMIFAKNPKKVEQISSELSFDTILEDGERIESHIYPTQQYADPQSYFVYHAIKSGKRLYGS